MLIPSKFSGYRKDGTRNLYAGGGIGEAALLEAIIGGAQTGAMIGGGSALLSGQDPLQGALRGGLMGGATGGVFKGVMPGAEAASAAPASSMPAGLPDAISSQTGSGLGFANPDFNPMPGTAGLGAPGTSMLGSNPSVQYALSEMPASIPGAGAPGASGMFGQAGQWWDTLTPKQQLMTGGAGVMGLGMLADRNKYGVPKQDPYTGPLSRFNFNPATYQPTYAYAEGGITDLNAGGYDRMVGEEPMYASNMNSGGIANLGGYSDGGRMLKGPGDGMSDSIPATIAGRRPARLATDEFVVPADVVSHLGNGSSDAGAKQLYAMMDKVRHARTGHKKQGREINPRKYMPA